MREWGLLSAGSAGIFNFFCVEKKCGGGSKTFSSNRVGEGWRFSEQQGICSLNSTSNNFEKFPEHLKMRMTSLLLLTFNCAKKKQPVGVVKSALEHALSNTEKPHLVVVGLEEVMPIMDGCFGLSQEYIEPIEQGIEKALGSHYKKCTKTVMGAVVLLTYINVGITVLNSWTAGARCGMYFSGLKGGAGARLKVKDTDGVTQEFTFVNAHLAANEGYAETRNRDFHSIARGLDFGDNYGAYKPDNHLFFMGDLNYRATRDSEELLNDGSPIGKDELVGEIRAQRAFYGFEEAEITFPPTYKYLIGSETEYKDNRTPSWCDRILYLSYGGEEQVSDYAPIPKVVTSDHKPLYLGISVPSKGPNYEFPNMMFEPDVGKPVSVKRDLDYLWWDNVVGSKVDLLIGWALYLGTSTKVRGIVAASLLVLFMLSYYS